MAYPGYPSGGGRGYPPQAAGSMGPGYPSGPPPPSSGAYPGYLSGQAQQQTASWTPPGSSPYPSEGLSFPTPTGGPTPYPTGGPAPYPSGGPAPYPSGGPAPYPSGGPAPYPVGSPAPYPSGGPAPYPPGGTPYPSGRPAAYPQSRGVGHVGPSYPQAPSTQQGGMGFGMTTPSGHAPAPYPTTSHIPTPYSTIAQQQTPGGYQTAPPPIPSISTNRQTTQTSHTNPQNATVAEATKGMSSLGVSAYKEPVTEGTVKPSSRFNAETDAAILRKAMKGFGTDEKAIISVVAYRSCQQRQDIKSKFKSLYGKDLIMELKSELSGHFEDIVLSLFMRHREFDAYILRKAIQGVGTDESALIEVLCTRSNEEIIDIKQQYKLDYSRDLEADVKSDTSGHFRRLLISMLTGGRYPSGPVDRAKARKDAQELYQAGEARWGTDESKFNQILASLSISHLQVIFEEYSKICKYDIEQSIEREMSGNLKEGMLTVVKCVRDKPGYFAERLYKSMKGLGTDDDTLVRVVVSRCEVDMVQIKKKFRTKYYKSLGSFIKGDTSGDYKRILLALAGED